MDTGVGAYMDSKKVIPILCTNVEVVTGGIHLWMWATCERCCLLEVLRDLGGVLWEVQPVGSPRQLGGHLWGGAACRKSRGLGRPPMRGAACKEFTCSDVRRKVTSVSPVNCLTCFLEVNCM